MRFLAQLVSGVFHPILIPLYAYSITRFSVPSHFEYLPYETDQTLMLRIVLNGLFFPVVSVAILRGLGWVKDLQFSTRESRHGVFILFMFFYIWLYFSFRLQDIFSDFLLMALLGGMIASILSFVINLVFTKLSVHAVGAGYVVSLLLVLAPLAEINLFLVLIGVVLLAGLVGTARLFLKAHTPPQVFLGYVIGILSIMIALNITY